jgi:plasmid stabilization system protein ParE
MTGYHFHPEADLDLDEIWEFIAQDSPAGADKVTDDIVAAIEALVSAPHIGHRRTDLTRPLRFWRVPNYLIAYAPDEMPMWVTAIIHGSRSSPGHGRDSEGPGMNRDSR